jgi:hypothetical protein
MQQTANGRGMLSGEIFRKKLANGR